MKSASEMSLEIRRKKKAMQADPSVVDLSGIPMDKTDEDVMDRNVVTKDLGLDHNMPKSFSEEPDDMHETSEPEAPKASMPPRDEEPESEAKLKRMMRLSKMLKAR
jgi:hypothetical protein